MDLQTEPVRVEKLESIDSFRNNIWHFGKLTRGKYIYYIESIVILLFLAPGLSFKDLP